MILVIGENITDVFVYCSSKRLSPEACCPVLIPENKILNSVDDDSDWGNLDN